MESSQARASILKIFVAASLSKASSAVTIFPGVSGPIAVRLQRRFFSALAPRSPLPSGAVGQLRPPSCTYRLSHNCISVLLKPSICPPHMSPHSFSIVGPDLPETADSLLLKASPFVSIAMLSEGNQSANVIDQTSRPEPQLSSVAVFAFVWLPSLPLLLSQSPAMLTKTRHILAVVSLFEVSSQNRKWSLGWKVYLDDTHRKWAVSEMAHIFAAIAQRKYRISDGSVLLLGLNANGKV